MSSETGAPRRLRIGEIVFDVASGEIRRSGASGEPTTRLPPQPARLLALLASRPGALVTREEIRRVIWDGVEIDVESSLHFCVRQIRAALGDSATSSRFIETLPRRGYRLVAPVEAIADESVTHRATRPPPSRFPRAPALALLFTALGVVAVLVGRGLSTASPAGVRIGVMTFERPGGEPNDVAETIVDRLTNASSDETHVVGPTTTSAYRTELELRRLATDYELAYIVNGRFLEGGGILAELIRVSDGAHVWAERFDEVDLGPGTGGEISSAVLNALAGR